MQTTFDPDAVFAAMSDATRRDIVLRSLGGREGVAELARHYPMSFAAVQKHVAILERAGLVTKQRSRAAAARADQHRGASSGARAARSKYEALCVAGSIA